MTFASCSCDLCANAGGEVLHESAKLRVVLVDDAHYPGFCRVIWNEHVREMTDLAPADRILLMNTVWQVEAAQRETLAPDKVNLASLGNMTPHVHWHVIPRFADDVHFPGAVWAQPQRSAAVDGQAARLAALPALRAAIERRLAQPGA